MDAGRALGPWCGGCVAGYIQFFRNTPPLVQLLFFYFALGQFTPVVTSADGWTVEVPVITNVGWAIISLSLFRRRLQCRDLPGRHRGGAGLDRARRPRAWGSRGCRPIIYVVLPLAFRVCLPALNNNLVNLVKTTTQAFAIAVPELLYHAVSHLERLSERRSTRPWCWSSSPMWCLVAAFWSSA